MNVENVSRDDWIFGGVGLLLVIDLLFLPWFSISVGPFQRQSPPPERLMGGSAFSRCWLRLR
jgi:hypothetical protein